MYYEEDNRRDDEKKLLEMEAKEKLIKQADSSDKKIPLKRERHSLLKAIFLKLKREDVI